ncbi:MAG: metallopeptidase family protein [Chloroflexota bacterium]|nr:metallopeptidase family protein [Chloroflexota bacterium]
MVRHPTRQSKRIRRHRFTRAVQNALQDLPPAIQFMLNNVEVVIADEPSDEDMEDTGPDAANELFGLYQGIPLTERGSDYSMVLPDKITLFRGPLERSFDDPREIAEQVRITVIHEIAHHFGIDEDRLDELGYA